MKLDPILEKFFKVLNHAEMANTAAVVIRTESYTAFTKDQLAPLKAKLPGGTPIIVIDPATQIEFIDEKAMNLAGWFRDRPEADTENSTPRRGRSSRRPEAPFVEPSETVPSGT